ncbi:YbjP/YqhG family protein [Scandinavium lactucae]|uniref:YbjP/YqhG family protein n=1 Tax=Scandinavium lactucae TaxID=3095028 RepID=A0ABU4QS51_9ENTR|nr:MULTISPECIES: YbjP/YqhG family protein [unclassified Scandinavium]MDX6041337.1 YbjP/YqhG family protein [Scandinavium sp. V105_6]MDX6051227.1 YbjP/YqhG family protein [Scandinavium sp. V105_1]
MRIILLLSLVLTGCAAHIQAPEATVKEFYTFYLNAYVSDNHADDLGSPQMRQYITKDTLARLKDIQGIKEQEIVSADYFTYSQDYAAKWISALEVGAAEDYTGGKVMNVWLGIEDGKTKQLRDYLRLEDGKWKIYRVVSVSDSYEQNIFDDNAISAAKAYAETIPEVVD